MIKCLKKQKTATLFILTFALLLFFNINCYAILSVETMYIPLQIASGTSIEYELRVYNESEEDTEVLISTKDCTRDLYGRYLLNDPGTVDNTLNPFMIISPTSFIIPAGSSHPINIEVAIPDDVSGPHWAVIVLQSGETVNVGSTDNSDPSSMGVVEAELSSGLGILITQSDPAEIVNTGRITQILSSKSEQLEKPGYNLGVIYENTGTTYQFGSGYFQITSSEGRIVGHIEADNFFVLPGGKYLMSGFLSEELSPGKYLILGVVDSGAQDLIAGQQLLVVEEEE